MTIVRIARDDGVDVIRALHPWSAVLHLCPFAGSGRPRNQGRAVARVER